MPAAATTQHRESPVTHCLGLALLNDFDKSAAYEAHRGRPRGRHQGGRDRLAEPHAPGLLGRGEDAPILDRFARYGLPLHLTETTLLRPRHAARDRGPQRLPAARVAVHAAGRGASGRGDRPPLPDPALPPVGPGGQLLGHDRRRRLARRAVRAHPGGRHRQAGVRVRQPACAVKEE
jgi:hypothetical protein